MAPNDPETVHATSVAIDGYGVIIIGPSGAGKTDLAIRLIDRGACLISDDRTILSRANNVVTLNPPEKTAGQIELHSLGIYLVQFISNIELKMIVELVNQAERYPMDSQIEKILDIQIPKIKLNAQSASAPIKVEMALHEFLRASG